MLKQQNPAPVLQHRDWRFLQRDFLRANPAFLPYSLTLLRNCLAPAASVAWYLLIVRPDLLERESLELLLPGSGLQECADGGRWFSFLPWLVGRPSLKVNVTLVGHELSATLEDGPKDSRKLSPEQLERELQTPAASALRSLPPARIVNGMLSDWAAQSLKTPDLCVLFAPGFEKHYATWLTEGELLPLLRAKVPVAAFAYSRIDSLSDCQVLKLCGLRLDPPTPPLRNNPWRVEHEGSFLWCFAQFCWDLAVNHVPETVVFDEDGIRELAQAQHYVRNEFLPVDDSMLQQMGARIRISNLSSGGEEPVVQCIEGAEPEAGDDHLLFLPDKFAVVVSDGEVGEMLEDGVLACPEPSIRVPAEVLAEWPPTPGIDRLLWAVRVHRDYVVPQLPVQAQDANHLFPDEELTPAVQAALHVIGKSKHPARGPRKPTPGTGGFFTALDNADFDRAALLAKERPGLLQAADEYGRTALMRLAGRGPAGLFVQWVEAGAILDVLDEAGQGLIHYVVQDDGATTLELLVEHGIDTGLKNYVGFTPASLCLTALAWKCLDLLITVGADIHTPSLRGLSVARNYLDHSVPEPLKARIEQVLGSGLKRA